MALEPGGYADKLGNRYEGRWVVKQLLRLLDERLKSVCLEAIGDDEVGVDLWVETPGGIRQAQQCKARNAGSEKWTFADLHARGILDAMRGHLDRGASNEFALVSAVEGKLIHDICQSARDSNGDPEAFFMHQIEAISEQRRRAFRRFCTYLNLDVDQEADRAIAFGYLRRLHVIHWEDDVESRDSLNDLVRMLVTGDMGLVIPALADFAQDNLRKTITAGDVRSFLASHNLHPRNLPHDSRVWPAVQKLQETFKQSISSGLIGGQLVPRTETDEVLKALRENGLVVVHGGAGSGKSGVLYELVRILEEQRHPYLPIRLDRQVPEHNPLQFGQDLGLPESPARCLESIAGKDLSVLILDQLDAIRWTSRHSLNSLEVCKTIATEISSLRDMGKPVAVVLACRTFDLEHDPEIKAWLHDGPQKRLTKVEIKTLKDENVKQVCERAGQKYDSLPKRQKELLRLPNHLAMWVQMVDSGQIPLFGTGPQLMRQFWKNRRNEVEKAGIASADIDAVLGKLVDYMERNASISAPLSLVEHKAGAMEALQSHSVLAVTGRSVSFAHQSYVDYQIASRLLAQVQAGHGSVRNWLGDRAKQSLFRREQLRQILTLLEEESQADFVANIRDILEDSNVRFHLKHLILELVSQLENPSHALLQYLAELIARDEWREHILETVCLRHAPYVGWLLRNGVLTQWLSADIEEDRNAALWLLRSVAESIPDQVSELLEPYAEQDDEWKKRVLACLCWNSENDSGRMFKLRLCLAKTGVFKDWENWDRLTKDHPDRAIRLIEAALSTWDRNDLRPEELQTRRRNTGTRSRYEQWTTDDREALLGAAQTYPELTWDLLVPHIQRLAVTDDDEVENLLKVWQDRMHRTVRDGCVGLAKGVLDVAIEAGKVLASQDGPSFFHRTEYLRDNESPVIQLMLVECYCALPSQLANETIHWLMVDPRRLILGVGIAEPKWMPAARLVEALSSYCSEAVFRNLEHYLLHFHSPNEKRMAEYYVKSWKKGYFGDYWGRAQYFLLPALDECRRSSEVVGLIGVLQRKYAGYPSWRFLDWPHGRGGFVGSTLPSDSLSEISDRAWLEDIIGNPDVPLEDRGHWREAENGGFRESSIRHFARDLATVTKRFPARFGRLALRFPNDVHPDYVAAILEGLQQTKPTEGSEEEKAQWAPASIELTEAVIARFLASDDRGVAGQFCSLLRERSQEQWSQSVLNRLTSYAMHHPEPEPGKLVVGNPGGDFDAAKASAHGLLTNALNVVRGKAALAIQALLRDHPDWLEFFGEALDSLVSDKHPVVRVAAVEACLPVLNIDRTKAVQWFAKACRDDPRVTACHAGVYFFHCCFKSHSYLLEPLVRAMVASPLSDVAQEGAKEVAARWLFHGSFQEELEACKSGTAPHRKGVAQVAAHFVLQQEHADACRPLLEAFLHDSDSEVRSEVKQAFRDKRIFSVLHGEQIVGEYLASQAYRDDPTPLFFAMEEYTGSLLPYTDLILGICRTFAGPLRDASRDMSTGIAGDVRMLPPLLLRLYEQAQDGADPNTINQCLDAWDLLFESRVGVVRELTHSLDQ